MIKNVFNIFKRKLANGKIIYYYYIYDSEGNRKQYSTGETDERKAYEVCLERMKNGTLCAQRSLSFGQYAADFFNYDTSPYIQRKLRRGFTYSRTYAALEQGQLRLHILPFFADYKIDEIDNHVIDSFIDRLLDKGLSRTSVNHILKLLNIIFKYAWEHRIIENNPMLTIKMLKNDTREKGLFTQQEITALFFTEHACERVWHGYQEEFLLTLTAYASGCRLGELQALQISDLEGDMIHVEHSLDRLCGIKSTKTGKDRVIPISPTLSAALNQLIIKHTGPFVFGKNNGERPIRHDEFYPILHSALETIGITKQERITRNLSFHSFRHGFTSRLLARGIPPHLVQALTGHSTRQMLDHYTHVSTAEISTLYEHIPLTNY